jgi:hypothetical protein
MNHASIPIPKNTLTKPESERASHPHEKVLFSKQFALLT